MPLQKPMLERMLAGELYRAGDPALVALRLNARETTYTANALPPSQRQQRMGCCATYSAR